MQHPNGTQPMFSAVEAILAAFSAAHDGGDFARARDILNRNSLTIWFHLDPHRLSQIISDIVSAEDAKLDTAFALHLFLIPAGDRRRTDPRVLDALATSQRVNPALLPATHMAEARLEGRLNDALEHSQMLGDVRPSIQPFRDTRDPVPQFIALQRGITAALAGRFNDALLLFHEARVRATVPGLEFQRRDALVRSALIHAAFGDPAEAHTLLDLANQVPRTASWAEATIDTSRDLALALLEPDPVEAKRILSRLNLSDVGEMWPFYVHARYRMLEESGSNSVAAQEIAALKELPFPHISGEGYTGSVFALAEASNHIVSGAPTNARQSLAEADHALPLTAVVQALLEVQTGAFQKAIDLASAARDLTLGLRRLEIWRISLLAHCYLMLGDTEQAVSALRAADAFPRPLDVHEAGFFSKDLRTLGQAHIERWPEGTHSVDTYMDRLPTQTSLLTQREHEVLVSLAGGATRAEIAASLFISLNTLKSQIRAIYRKLDAGSREDALRIAAERGLL